MRLYSHSYKLYLDSLYYDNTNKRNELFFVLKKALSNELTKKQQDVLKLYFYDNLKQTEIADILQIDKSGVSRHLHKAIKKLKHFLEYNIYQ